jgi:hypothetical protein
MATQKHYTAVLTIHETVETVDTPGFNDRRVSAPKPSRDSSEVGKIVVRGDSMTALREKIAAHAALLD